MSDLIAKIQAAQREAGERAVIAHLEQMGLIQPAPITSESGNQAAQGASAITSEVCTCQQGQACQVCDPIHPPQAEAVPLLTDTLERELSRVLEGAINMGWISDESRQAIEQAVRSKLVAPAPTEDQMRDVFEQRCMAALLARRDRGVPTDGDHGGPVTRQDVCWRTATGFYGVIQFNAAWEGFQWGVRFARGDVQ